MARGKLSELGLHGVVVSCVALCDLKRLGIGFLECVEVLEQLCNGYKNSNDIETELRGIFNRSQDALMAYRRDDFLTIQEEPPFNDLAQAELKRYFEAWKEGGNENLKRQYELSMAMVFTDRKNLSPLPPIKILNGNGSFDSPIELSAPDIRKRVRAENWYLNYEFGAMDEDWTYGSHMTTFNTSINRQMSLWNFELKDGTPQKIFFDTSLYGAA